MKLQLQLFSVEILDECYIQNISFKILIMRLVSPEFSFLLLKKS